MRRVCSACGKDFPGDFVTMSPVDGRVYCPGCFDARFKECDVCHGLFFQVLLLEDDQFMNRCLDCWDQILPYGVGGA